MCMAGGKLASGGKPTASFSQQIATARTSGGYSAPAGPQAYSGGLASAALSKWLAAFQSRQPAKRPVSGTPARTPVTKGTASIKNGRVVN